MNKCVCVCVRAHICFGHPEKRVIMKDVVEREHGLETFLAYVYITTQMLAPQGQ